MREHDTATNLVSDLPLRAFFNHGARMCARHLRPIFHVVAQYESQLYESGGAGVFVAFTILIHKNHSWDSQFLNKVILRGNKE